MEDFDFSGLADFGGAFGDIDISCFDFEGKSGIVSRAYRNPVVRKPQKVAYEHAIEFAEGIEIEKGMRTFAFVSGNFIFGDFLEALVQLGKVSIERITVQTLSMSQDNIDSMRNVLEMEQPSSLHLVLSAYWYSHERGGLVPYMLQELDITEDFRCAFASVHTKIITILTKGGMKLCMYGSANLRSSFNVEQFEIVQDDGLYDFIECFVEGLLDEYDIVNEGRNRPKPLRGGKTWQAGLKVRKAQQR